MQAQRLEGGFADAPLDSARAFRAVMNVMAQPGRIETVSAVSPPGPLSVAAGVVMLTLRDPDSPVFLAGAFDTADVQACLLFHTGAPVAGPFECSFAFGAWPDLRDAPFRLGTPEYPDRSATIVIELPNLAARGASLLGPGIRATAALNLPERAAFQANHALFPMGVDHIFTCSDRVAALPRSTEVL